MIIDGVKIKCYCYYSFNYSSKNGYRLTHAHYKKQPVGDKPDVGATALP